MWKHKETPMSQLLEKLTPPDYVTTTWSGGTTTQLLIAPAGADYAHRDFLWRVSSATVALEESDFTSLPDYRRLIATLQGDIVLTHNAGAPVTLRPCEVHAFDGGDRTKSVGCCRDFNLMLRKGRADGRMESIELQQFRRLIPHECCQQQLVYCVRGSCRISALLSGEDVQPQSLQLDAGQTLLIRGPVSLLAEPLDAHTLLMYCQMWRTEL